MTIRVVLADDDHLVRSGLAMILEVQSDIDVLAEVADGAQALDAVRRHRPDVAVLDVRMPVMDGVEVARIIAGEPAEEELEETAPTGIVMITNYNVSEAVYAAMRAGATGFVLKDAAPEELAAAIRSVAAGEAWLDPGVTRTLIEEFARRPRSALPAPQEVDRLTAREREVLVLMAHGLSNDEVADHLSVVVGTVKTHVNRLFMKLAVRDRAQAVALAYRSRLVGPDDPPPADPPPATAVRRPRPGR